jgi:hypothetical protein
MEDAGRVAFEHSARPEKAKRAPGQRVCSTLQVPIVVTQVERRALQWLLQPMSTRSYRRHALPPWSRIVSVSVTVRFRWENYQTRLGATVKAKGFYGKSVGD